jgi:hypothetical protein
MSLSRSAGLATAAILLGALGAAAQQSAGPMRSRRCDPVASTSFSFGLTGGNLRPTGWHITPGGIVSAVGDSGGAPSPRRTVSRQTLRALARRAWHGGFTRLPTAPTHPTRNPDAARQYIEIHSACGAKHVEYAAGDAAPAFRELYTRLGALTQSR